MTLDQSIAFLIFALVAAITPGPSNVMITATGAAAGMIRGVPCALGAATGMASLVFCAALGIGQLVLDHPVVLTVMNWTGAAFLLWLAWKIATAGRTSEVAATEPVGFVSAAMLQWINPKGWLVGVSAGGTYLHATADNAIGQAATLGGLFFLAAFPSGLVWLVLGASVHRLLRDNRSAQFFNIAMGLALAASVVMILR